MIGGGKWSSQNKILPGAYMNFVSRNTGSTSPKQSDTGGGSGGTTTETTSLLGAAVVGHMILGT